MSQTNKQTAKSFASLGEAVEHSLFAEADLALRRGGHIDRDAGDLYEFLTDAVEVLTPFYQRFGCDLIHPSEGYFYLLPTNDQLGKRHLSVAEMIVGQGLALMYLDPAAAERTGHTGWEEVITHLVSVMGRERLVGALNPSKKKRIDERVAEQTVRSKVTDALRKLAQLGFVDLLKDGQYRLRPALMRFAEPVRGSATPEMALRKLVERGEVVLGEPEDGVDEPGASQLAPEASSQLQTATSAEQSTSAAPEAAMPEELDALNGADVENDDVENDDVENDDVENETL